MLLLLLGGKDYTAEDLKRDILRIEAEDEMWRQTCIQGKILREIQDLHTTDMKQNCGRYQRQEDLEELADKIYRELEKEELNNNGYHTSISPHDQITAQ